MRRSFIVPLALLAATAAQAGAQAAAPAPRAITVALLRQQDDARLYVNRLLEGITLTAEQRASVDSIVQRWSINNAQEANQPVTQEPQDTTDRRPSPNNPNPFAPQTVDYTQLEAQVRSVLTPDQQRIWDANVQRVRPHRRA